jgi:hypothetical protein
MSVYFNFLHRASDPVMGVDDMQNVLIYFFTEIHPTMNQQPEFIRFRNAVWESRHLIFENPQFVHWMISNLRNNWKRLHENELRSQIIMFMYHFIWVFTGTGIREYLESIRGTYSIETAYAEARWNSELHGLITCRAPFLGDDELPHRLEAVIGELENRLIMFNELPEREAMLNRAVSAPHIANHTSIRDMPTEVMRRIIAFSQVSNINSSRAPSADEIRNYIRRLPVWREFH